jgi:hypothetical protein
MLDSAGSPSFHQFFYKDKISGLAGNLLVIKAGMVSKRQGRIPFLEFPGISQDKYYVILPFSMRSAALRPFYPANVCNPAYRRGRD